ncbi:MAG: hypothetical protein AAFU85_13195, partial [Planctomycetota bacterium]
TGGADADDATKGPASDEAAEAGDDESATGSTARTTRSVASEDSRRSGSGWRKCRPHSSCVVIVIGSSRWRTTLAGTKC